MREVQRYYQFINEKYTEDPEYRIEQFFKELEKNIKFWFTEGTLGATESELININISRNKGIDKDIMFDFKDEEFYYQVIIIISLEGVAEEELIDCFIKVKKYDNDANLIRTLGEDVSIKDIDEDLILTMFSKLDDESESAMGNPGTLSDEDTDLEDTNII